jgi:hypothetical protein
MRRVHISEDQNWLDGGLKETIYFSVFSVKLTSETRTCARVARDMSPFITKRARLPFSPIMKACASPFITKAGASFIPNIERRVLQMNVSVSYVSYKSYSQLWQNSGGI